MVTYLNIWLLRQCSIWKQMVYNGPWANMCTKAVFIIRCWPISGTLFDVCCATLWCIIQIYFFAKAFLAFTNSDWARGMSTYIFAFWKGSYFTGQLWISHTKCLIRNTIHVKYNSSSMGYSLYIILAICNQIWQIIKCYSWTCSFLFTFSEFWLIMHFFRCLVDLSVV